MRGNARSIMFEHWLDRGGVLLCWHEGLNSSVNKRSVCLSDSLLAPRGESRCLGRDKPRSWRGNTERHDIIGELLASTQLTTPWTSITTVREAKVMTSGNNISRESNNHKQHQSAHIHSRKDHNVRDHL